MVNSTKGKQEGCQLLSFLYGPWLAPRRSRHVVLFGSVGAVGVLSGLVSVPAVSPVAAALAVLIVVVASVPV